MPESHLRVKEERNLRRGVSKDSFGRENGTSFTLGR